MKPRRPTRTELEFAAIVLVLAVAMANQLSGMAKIVATWLR